MLHVTTGREGRKVNKSKRMERIPGNIVLSYFGLKLDS